MIKIGDKIPNLVLRSKNDKIYEFNADEFFSHKIFIINNLYKLIFPYIRLTLIQFSIV